MLARCTLCRWATVVKHRHSVSAADDEEARGSDMVMYLIAISSLGLVLEPTRSALP